MVSSRSPGGSLGFHALLPPVSPYARSQSHSCAASSLPFSEGRPIYCRLTCATGGNLTEPSKPFPLGNHVGTREKLCSGLSHGRQHLNPALFFVASRPAKCICISTQFSTNICGVLSSLYSVSTLFSAYVAHMFSLIAAPSSSNPPSDRLLLLPSLSTALFLRQEEDGPGGHSCLWTFIHRSLPLTSFFSSPVVVLSSVSPHRQLVPFVESTM